MMHYLMRAAMLVAFSLSVISCGTIETNHSIDRYSKQTNKAFYDLSNKTNAPYQLDPGLWLTEVKPLPIEPEKPAFLLKPYRTGSSKPMGLKEIAEMLTKDRGIKVRIEPDVFFPDIEGDSKKSETAAPKVTDATKKVLNASSNSEDSGSEYDIKFPFSFTNGSVEKFLDMVASRMGIVWRVDKDAVVFHRYQSQDFQVHLLPTSTTSTASLDGSGGTTQSSKIEMTVDPWQSTIDAVKGMLSKGGTLTPNKATTTLVVKDTPYVLSNIESYIASENIKLKRQVLLKVDLLAMSREDADNRGLSLNALFDEGKTGWSLASPGFETSGSGLLSGQIIDTGSSFFGSEAVVNALTTRENAVLLRSLPITALNMQPAPVSLTNRKAYLAEVSTTESGDDTKQELKADTIITGYLMTLISNILNNDQLILQYSIDQSRLVQLDEITSGNNGDLIQLPEDQKEAFVGQAVLKSGSVLAVAGYTETSLSESSTSMATEILESFGFSKNNNKGHDMLVILISPVILETDS